MIVYDLCRDPSAPQRRCNGVGCKCAGHYKYLYEAEPVATRFIHLDGSPVLRQRARPVPEGMDVAPLVAALFATMRAAGGIGLSAPQIGVSLRVAVVEVPDASWALINPEITSRSAETDVAEEGCLSLPGRSGMVRRPENVGLVSMFNDGPFLASGIAARALQHELDHLDGVLFTDKLEPRTVLKTDGRAWRSHQIGPLPPMKVRVHEDGMIMCPGCGLIAPWGDALGLNVPVMCHGFKDVDGTGRCHAVFEVHAQRGWRSWL